MADVMSPLAAEPEVVKFVLQNGVGLHTPQIDADFFDPLWQRQQLLDFVDIAVAAERVGFDGVSLVEHHALPITAPSPHLLLAAAALRTSRIRLASAVTVLPLYSPIRVAEEAAMLDLLSNGRFELGIGRGTGEVERVSGGAIGPDESTARWIEGIELLDMALTQRELTFDGAYTRVLHPYAVPTRPLQNPLPVWTGARSLESVERAARKGWSVFRNVGSDEDHRIALERYIGIGAQHGFAFSGANFMVERFVFIGQTEAEAQANFVRTSHLFERFHANLSANGRFTLPPSVNGSTAAPAGPPPDAVVVGTPETVSVALEHTLMATGARRLMVEVFSWPELNLFANEVMPRVRTAGAARRMTA
jgi:alkanesulfonate monooxygenase SsuD/methylene tetrahydromethanopterin reductase-like flavin-dependent oxidoreductase (luciferase family)